MYLGTGIYGQVVLSQCNREMSYCNKCCYRQIIVIKNIKTTSMEVVSTGVPGKNKECLRSNHKAKDDMMYQRHI